MTLFVPPLTNILNIILKLNIKEVKEHILYKALLYDELY